MALGTTFKPIMASHPYSTISEWSAHMHVHDLFSMNAVTRDSVYLSNGLGWWQKVLKHYSVTISVANIKSHVTIDSKTWCDITYEDFISCTN